MRRRASCRCAAAIGLSGWHQVANTVRISHSGRRLQGQASSRSSRPEYGRYRRADIAFAAGWSTEWQRSGGRPGTDGREKTMRRVVEMHRMLPMLAALLLAPAGRSAASWRTRRSTTSPPPTPDRARASCARPGPCSRACRRIWRPTRPPAAGPGLGTPWRRARRYRRGRARPGAARGSHRPRRGRRPPGLEAEALNDLGNVQLRDRRAGGAGFLRGRRRPGRDGRAGPAARRGP